MAKNKETDNKNDNKEQKVVKKSSYSKKKKATGSFKEKIFRLL